MSKLTKARQEKIKRWLKAHGHNKAKVDGLEMPTDDAMKTAILALHGVSESEHQAIRPGRAT